MPALNTDLVRNAAPNFATTLSGAMLNTDTSLTLASATGLPTATAITLVIDATDPTTGASTPSLKEVVTGTLSGTTVSNLLRGQDGTSALGHASGANVVMWITSNLWNDFQTAFLQDHGQLGRHKTLTDANGNTWFGQTATASAVNYWNNANAATGGKPVYQLTGSDTNISGSIKAKGTGLVDIDGAVPVKFFGIYDFIESGCVWTADAAGSTLNGSMTSGVVWLAGKRLTVAAVTAHAFTASKDTYVDFSDNGDGTAVVNYTEATNNAASPALTAGRLRNAIIVTGAGSIAASTSINQGQETMVLPIASSIPYAVTDSLGNLICPRDPQRKLLGYRQITSNFTLSSSQQTQTLVTGLSCPVIVPGNRKIKVTLGGSFVSAATSGDRLSLAIWDGTVGSGTQVASSDINAANFAFATPEATLTPSATSKTYNAGISNLTAARNVTLNAGSTQPAWIKVELM